MADAAGGLLARVAQAKKKQLKEWRMCEDLLQHGIATFSRVSASVERVDSRYGEAHELRRYSERHGWAL
jgi:hypothetical protein